MFFNEVKPSRRNVHQLLACPAIGASSFGGALIAIIDCATISGTGGVIPCSLFDSLIPALTAAVSRTLVALSLNHQLPPAIINTTRAVESSPTPATGIKPFAAA